MVREGAPGAGEAWSTSAVRRAGAARPAGEALIGGAPGLTVTVGGLFAYAEALQIFTFMSLFITFLSSGAFGK